jgi:hypothetical protein
MLSERANLAQDVVTACAGGAPASQDEKKALALLMNSSAAMR